MLQLLWMLASGQLRLTRAGLAATSSLLLVAQHVWISMGQEGIGSPASHLMKPFGDHSVTSANTDYNNPN